MIGQRTKDSGRRTKAQQATNISISQSTNTIVNRKSVNRKYNRKIVQSYNRKILTSPPFGKLGATYFPTGFSLQPMILPRGMAEHGLLFSADVAQSRATRPNGSMATSKRALSHSFTQMKEESLFFHCLY